jgi:hypothetical protein
LALNVGPVYMKKFAQVIQSLGIDISPERD